MKIGASFESPVGTTHLDRRYCNKLFTRRNLWKAVQDQGVQQRLLSSEGLRAKTWEERKECRCYYP